MTVLLDLLTTRAALALADSEASDWIGRPCCIAQPDDLPSDGEPERLRAIALGGASDGVQFIHAGLTNSYRERNNG